MKKVKLVDICKIQYGFAFDSSLFSNSNNGMPLIRIRDVVRGFTDTYTSEAFIEDYVVNKGDLLIGMDGEFNIAEWQSEKALLNQRVCKLIPSSTVGKRYIYYSLIKILKQIEEKTAFVTVKHLSAKELNKVEILLPSLEEQKAIAGKLDKVSNLIEKRKQQIKKLDELVKSRFIEMFGDESKYQSTPLNESVEEMFIGPFGSSLKNECFVSKENGYCMVYEQKHAIRKTMDVDTRYVDEKKYTELQRFTIQAGDIIVSCRGTIGETFVVPNGAPMGIMHPSIMKIRLKESAYNKVFFNHLLIKVLKQHEAEANGSGIKMAITATELGKELFIVPPMNLQQQFAAFVEQIDKSKFEIQKSLEKLEILKKSLMQQYFG